VGGGHHSGIPHLTPTKAGGEGGTGAPDPRVSAYRDDLADERLRGAVKAARYVAGGAARVVGGVVPVRRGPAAAAETLTFCHYGEPVLVFDESGGYAWCQSLFDKYVGYVETQHLAPGPVPAPTHFVATVGSHIYAAPDLRSPVLDFLPRHSAVTVAETGLLTRGTEYARLDTGGHLPLACLSPGPPRSPDLVAAASLYLGCPYLWGGRSWLGVDCSGLVQSAFRDIGMTVLRDTDMQRDTIGAVAAIAALADLRRGDLLYMPGHVLIHADDGDVIHADGSTMTVRRDNLADWLRARGLDLAGFIVRRP
jgi:cell wall-associated NlpC family hydrolase